MFWAMSARLTRSGACRSAKGVYLWVGAVSWLSTLPIEDLNVVLIESRQGQGTRVWVTLPADRALSPRFKTPESVYRHSGASLVLTELADILDNSCFGPIFED